MSRVALLVSSVLVVLVAAVTAARAVHLARNAGSERHALLTAHGERRWLDWSYRDPTVGARLATAESELAPGEAVVLAVPAKRYEERWLRVMARYYLPAQPVAEVYEVGAGAAPPPAGSTVVELSADGGVAVRRGGVSGGVGDAGSIGWGEGGGEGGGSSEPGTRR